MGISKSKSRNKKEREEALFIILERFARDRPKPHCELYYTTPYQLLVSVVLSAQTTDKMVNRCMKPLYDKGLSPELVVHWGEEELRRHIKSIGLANTKARHVFRLSKILLEEHGGRVPTSREALEKLPGVGRKTASVVLGELFQQPTLAVDTHVFRVSRRLGWHTAKTLTKGTPLAVERVLLALLPSSYLPRAHHWLVLHGRYVCTAKKPKCGECFLNDVCPSVDFTSGGATVPSPPQTPLSPS